MRAPRVGRLLRIALASLICLVGVATTLLVAQENLERGIEVFLTSGEANQSYPGGYRDEWNQFAIEYNPKDPAEFHGYEVAVVFGVENHSDKPISVPRNFDGQSIRFCGCVIGGGKLWLVPTNKVKPEMVEVAPGQTHVFFNLPLNEILADYDVGAAVADREPRNFIWNWRHRPGPPASPIHGRLGGYEPFALFWAEVEVAEQTLRSEPIIIKVAEANK
jgi:hypothetical protein